MALYRKGWSYAEIAREVGLTRSGVAGCIYRYKSRGGPPAAPIPARKVKVHAPKTRKPRRILTEDHATREALGAVNRSGMTDCKVAEAVGIHYRTINRWRAGRKGSPFLVACVLDYAQKNTPGY